MRRYTVVLEVNGENERAVEEELEDLLDASADAKIVSVVEKGMRKFREWYTSYAHINQEDVADELKDRDEESAKADAKRVGGILRTIYESSDDGVVYIIYKKVKK